MYLVRRGKKLICTPNISSRLSRCWILPRIIIAISAQKDLRMRFRNEVKIDGRLIRLEFANRRSRSLGRRFFSSRRISRFIAGQRISANAGSEKCPREPPLIITLHNSRSPLPPLCRCLASARAGRIYISRCRKPIPKYLSARDRGSG